MREYNESKMPYSSSLTDTEWEIIKPLLPQKKRTRPPKWSQREILDGILYQLKNGCNWQDLPKDLPPYSTVYWHYKQWRTEGVMEKIRDVLQAQVRQQVKKAVRPRSGFPTSVNAHQDKLKVDNFNYH